MKDTVLNYVVVLIIVRIEVLGGKNIAYCVRRHHISKKNVVLMSSELETIEACTQASLSSPGKRAAASSLSQWLYSWGTTGIKTLSEAPGDQSDFVKETLKHGLAYFPHSFTMKGIYVLAFPVRSLQVMI